MKQNIYVLPKEFTNLSWSKDYSFAHIDDAFKFDSPNFLENTVGLEEILQNNNLLCEYKLIIIFPMPLQSTYLLDENYKDNNTKWFSLLDRCLLLCKNRPDTRIVSGTDWDEHNVSCYENKSLIKLIIDKFRYNRVDLAKLTWLYSNPFVPEWLAQETSYDKTTVNSFYYSSYLPRCKELILLLGEPDYFVNKTHWFLSLNRNVRQHRTNLAYWWYKNKRRPAHISYRMMSGSYEVADKALIKKWFKDINLGFHDNKMKDTENYYAFVDSLPWHLDTPDAKKTLDIEYQDCLSKKFISESACYIPTETHCTNDLYYKGFITEKTYKTFVFGMPSIWISSAHTIEACKKLGFRSFGKLINEEYDKEENLSKRMNMVLRELDRIQKIEDITYWYRKGIDVYRHNFTKIKELTEINYVDKVGNYHDIYAAKYGTISNL